MTMIPVMKKLAAAAALACAVAAPALVASPAHAEYVPEHGWRRGPAPVVVVPPPRVVYVRPYRHWVHAHRNWRGFWVPGHWS